MTLNDLIQPYVELVKDVGEFATLGDKYVYQLADSSKSSILSTNAIELDIKSAFPTLCRLMYGEDNSFVQQIYNIKGKFERNKFISIQLTAQSKKDGKTYLQDLNYWSKVLSIGYLYARYEDIVVIQYIKDGVVFSGKIKDNPDNNSKLFYKFVNDNNVIFHEKFLDSFIRFNRTTIIKYGNELSIKGAFKDPPEYIRDVVIPTIIAGNIYDYKQLDDIKLHYSKKYYLILRETPLPDDLVYYYKINNQYINEIGKPCGIMDLDPRSYMRYIVHPILSLYRLKQNNR